MYPTYDLHSYHITARPSQKEYASPSMWQLHVSLRSSWGVHWLWRSQTEQICRLTIQWVRQSFGGASAASRSCVFPPGNRRYGSECQNMMVKVRTEIHEFLSSYLGFKSQLFIYYGSGSLYWGLCIIMTNHQDAFNEHIILIVRREVWGHHYSFFPCRGMLTCEVITV